MPATPPTLDDQRVVIGPPSGRVFTNWSTVDLEVAEALTNGGALLRAADLCWSIMGDGRVRAGLETRVKGLLKLPLTWEAGERESRMVIRRLEGGDFYTAHSEGALYVLCAWGLLLGIGIAQRVWEMRDGRWIGVLKPYDARLLRWDTFSRKWFVRTAAGEVEVKKGDRRWVLYAPSSSTEWPDGDERPWMYGAWRAVSRAWLGKYFAWGDWQHHAEVHGSPIRTAEYSDVKELVQLVTKALRDDLAAALGSMGGNTAAIPPAGFKKLSLLEAVAKTWEMFPGVMDAASREIVIAITGQASSTEVQQGQETGATLHGQVRQDLIDADARSLSTCLREQCLRDYTALNFSAEERAPWPKWRTEPPLNIARRGAAWKAFAEGIEAAERVAPPGMVVDRAAAFEDAGIPLMKAPAAAPVPTPMENAA